MNNINSITDEKLKRLFEEIAQEITRRINKTGKPFKVNFPYGYIRTINSLVNRWPYLSEGHQRTLACILQTSDINRWVLNIWNIGLTAGECFEWYSSLLVIAACEMLAVQYLKKKGWVNLKTKLKYNKAIDKLYENKVIDESLWKCLYFLRQIRDEIHLYRKSRIEMYKGKPIKHNFAVIVLSELEKAIKAFEK